MTRNTTYCSLLPLIALLIALLAGCQLKDRTVHYSFVQSQTDKRIHYQPGAQQFAVLVKNAMPNAVAKVETRHNREFFKPIAVHICATEDEFKRITGFDVEAHVSPKGLFLSPYLLRYPQVIPGVLTHELSHLHIQQQIGSLKLGRLPLWFVEGVATWVAEGGGAYDTTDNQAYAALLDGPRFKPVMRRGLLLDQLVLDKHQQTHLFYRQAMLFVKYLDENRIAQFQQLLADVQQGVKFSKAFGNAFSEDMETIWREFLEYAEVKVPN